MDLRTDREKGRRAINERRVGTITWMISQGAPNLCHNCPERLSESDCGLFAQSGCHHHGLLLHCPSPPASPSSGSNRSTGVRYSVCRGSRSLADKSHLAVGTVAG